MSSVLVTSLSVLFTVGIINLLRKLSSTKIDIDSKRTLLLSELRKKYAKWSVFSIILNLILLPIFTVAWFMLMRRIVDIRFGTYEEMKFLFVQNSGLWMVLSLFLALVTGVLVCFSLNKMILKEKYIEFLRFYNLSYGFNALKALKRICFIISLIAIVAIVLGLNNYTEFNEDNIKLNPMFSLSENTYMYSDIVGLQMVSHYKAPNGNIVKRPRFIVRFSDGSEWNSYSNGIEYNSVEEDVVLDFISKKSNIQVQYLQLQN